MSQKIEELKQKLEQRRIDAIIITNKVNIKYLLGIEAEGIFIITPYQNVFLTKERYFEYVKSIIPIEDGVNVVSMEKASAKEISDIFYGLDIVGIEEKSITYAEYLNYLDFFDVSFVQTEDIVEEMRETKTDDELRYIKYVSDILSTVMEKNIFKIRKGMTEKEIANNILKDLKLSDLDGVSGDVRVQSGENTKKTYFMPTARRIKSGDIVIITFGGEYNGYRAEIGRTVFVESVEDKVRNEYERLLKIHDNLLRSIKNRAEISKIVKQIKDELEEINWNVKYDIAHGIGLEEIEAPEFKQNTVKELKNRMTLVLEPGIYKSNYGLKIVDTIVVSDFGFTIFTKIASDINIV